MIRLLFTAILLLATVESSALAQIQPTAAPSEPIPLEVFARLPEIERPRINTDGTALALKVRGGGEQYLAIIELDTPDRTPLVISRDGEFDEIGDMRTTNWEWIDADNLLVWLASRTDVQGQKVDATRVIAYNRRTRELTRLGWRGTFVRGSDVIWRSTSGPPRILLARFATGRGYERLFNQEVIEIDVTNGRERLVTAPRRGISSWSADGAGNLRLGTSFDSRTGVSPHSIAPAAKAISAPSSASGWSATPWLQSQSCSCPARRRSSSAATRASPPFTKWT